MGNSASISSNAKSEDFFLHVARGQVPGHRAISRGGMNPDIDTGASESMWDFGGLYTFPSAASVMTISSSSAADTAAGTGARTVLVTGLDANYNEIQEVVALNGQTGVNTVNSYLRCHGMTVLTAGSGGTAAGNIHQGTGTITAGVPANVFAYIGLGWNTSQAVAYTVPAGYTAYLLNILTSAISSAVNQNTQLSIRQRAPGGVFLRGGTVVISNSPVFLEYQMPRAFPEKTDIDAIATTTDSNVVATIAARILLISNTLGD